MSLSNEIYTLFDDESAYFYSKLVQNYHLPLFNQQLLPFYYFFIILGINGSKPNPTSILKI